MGRNNEALSHLPLSPVELSYMTPKKEGEREGAWNKRVLRRTAAAVDAALLSVTWICGALWDQRVEQLCVLCGIHWRGSRQRDLVMPSVSLSLPAALAGRARTWVCLSCMFWVSRGSVHLTGMGGIGEETAFSWIIP